MNIRCHHCGAVIPSAEFEKAEELPSGKRICIWQDQDPPNPREDWDTFGTMVCFHRRYSLGDRKHGFSPDSLREHVSREDVIALPIYLIDHGGIAIRTSDFGDPWDSGQVGYIFVEYEKVFKEWSCTEMTPELRDQAIAALKCEVETYSQYLEGSVYGFTVYGPDGEELDSCGGFFGHDPETNGIYDRAGEKP